MTPKPKPETFDCVEFKRQAQEKIYEEIKDLSIAEQLEYFRRKAASGPLGSWWSNLVASEEHRRSGPQES